jgi:hypothetical protein
MTTRTTERAQHAATTSKRAAHATGELVQRADEPRHKKDGTDALCPELPTRQTTEHNDRRYAKALRDALAGHR